MGHLSKCDRVLYFKKMKIEYYQTINDVGIVGKMNTIDEFSRIGLPSGLENKSLLDIGCNTGAFIIEAKKRKATRVVGVEVNDDWRWLANGILDEVGILNAKNRVYKNIDDIEGKFDIVLLLSVLHVTENPQILLDKAWEMTTELMIVEINDRLQDTKIILPPEAVYYGKNKDNRSVYRCFKNNI